MIGSSLGPYKILESLGAGGMGEVFLAEDTRLNRKVAVKVLPAEFAADPERLARFEQEARAAAALNHPHIAAVFDVGAEAGDGEVVTHYIVQEYLEGETLREPLKKGAVPVNKALLLAREIAEGLGAAHGAGIIHRDLKPDNIFITKDGHAKILDFGLAKLTETANPAGTGISMSPTVLGTVAGQVMGTAGYMSPEQVEGEAEIDARADLFAFGCVLYEMAGGKRAFGGKSVLDTLHAIARTEPQPIADIKPDTPADLERIIKKCLAKDRAHRYQHADDLLVDLKTLAVEVEAGTAARSVAPQPGVNVETRPVGLSWKVAVPAAVAIAAVAVFATSMATRPAPEEPEIAKRFIHRFPDGERISTSASPLALSRNNEMVAMMAVDEGGVRRLKVRRLDRLEGTYLDGTANAVSPFFSPDGRWVAFGQGQLKRISVDGGPPMVLSEMQVGRFSGGSWGENNEIVFSDSQTLYRIPGAGGEATAVMSIDAAAGETAMGAPFHVTGANAVTYTVARGGAFAIGVVRLDTGESRILREGAKMATYLQSGHLMYLIGDAAFVAPFDNETLELTGDPVPVLQNIRSRGPTAAISVSSNGMLAFVEGGGSGVEANLSRLPLDGRAPETLAVPVRQGGFWYPRPSPDGRSIAYRVVTEAEGSAIMIHDVDRDVQMIFASGGFSLEWSPDGEWIYYSIVADDGYDDIYRRRADLSDEPQLLVDTDRYEAVRSISPDGEWMLGYSNSVSSGPDADLWLLPLAEGGEPQPLFANPDANEVAGRFAPDGGWIAWVSNESGTYEVYVTSFPNQGGVSKVSADGGMEPVWSPDSRRLYYKRGPQIYGVDIDPAAGVASSAELVVTGRFTTGTQWAGSYAMAPDGESFVAFTPAGDEADGETPGQRIFFVVDWFDELRQRFLTGGR